MGNISKIIEIGDSEGWESLLPWLPSSWEEKMRETKAFERARKIKSPSDFLRLILAYPVLGKSLPDLASWAAQEGIANISFPSLWERFQKTVPFLRWLLKELLDSTVDPVGSDFIFTPLDGSTFTLPGSREGEWKLHLLWANGKPIDLRLTKNKGKGNGESLKYLENVPKNVVLLGDRAYGTPPQIADADEKDRKFVVRFTWNNLPLFEDPEKRKKIDPFIALEGMTYGEIREFEAWVCPKKGKPTKVRIVTIQKDKQSEERSRRKSRRESKRKGHTPRKQTLFLAAFITVVTNLSTEIIDAETVLQAYRWRWQIEREFKRLKSTSGVRKLDNYKDASVEFYLLSLFISWLLTGIIIRKSAFFPWGYPIFRSRR